MVVGTRITTRDALQVVRENLLGAPIRQPGAAVVSASGLADHQIGGQELRLGHLNFLYRW